ncbi:N-acetylmuramoyl-L-alanine amidase [Planococcus sp. A6]|uniref:peptidoglycan recognition protein family protein n=1 Tax=Planococcus sp. A6 TaxID=2992760 RepID=UPI00237ADAFF|nr:N-acetylmuramoyl-L-alanine amidase [Planococcus sp. A6]MDE0582251.1 N-acetylmuramoyl-L-alanine amidase [Planococcus sp. A6]
MAYEILNRFIPESKYKTKAPYHMIPQSITIHNTWNDAAALSEISYMTNNANMVSYHAAIDDRYAVQAIPFSRNAFHAGDGGNGKGNRTSIGIEICYSKSGGPKYAAAEENAIEYVAHILKDKGWGMDRVKWHRDWSGKNCPHRILDEGRAQSVRNRIGARLAELKGEKVPSKPSAVVRDYLLNGDSSPAVKILQESLNKTGVRPPLDADGIFGDATEKAVRAFQKSNNLLVDGIWGKASQSKLDAILANLNKPNPPAKPAEKPKEDEEVKEAIVIGSSADYGSAEILSIRTKTGIYPKRGLPDNRLEHVYLVGATKDGIDAAKFTVLSGGTRFKTAQKVEEYLKKM